LHYKEQKAGCKERKSFDAEQIMYIFVQNIDKMHTEIIRIIEAGLKKDPKKVSQYVDLLIKKLKKEGDERSAERLQRTLSLNSDSFVSMATLDEITAQAPVDNESRVSMVEVENPLQTSRVIIDESIQEALNTFIKKVNNKDELLKAGVATNLSLMLYGPPGCGKTTLANYIAKETNLPLVTARLDTLVSSLLGSTAKNIRKVFDFANNKPCILFIDEFDAIAKARDDEYEHGELKRVINSLLQSIDQFDNVLITATNHSKMLDSAVWRRFNTVIKVNRPASSEFTEGLVNSFTENFTLDFKEDKKRRDKLMVVLSNSSPSEIKTVCNNAITNSIINKDTTVRYIEFLKEAFKYKNHGKVSNEELIAFLNENLITQIEISEDTGMSLRKVKETITKFKEKE